MNKSELFYEEQLLDRWLIKISEYRKFGLIEADQISVTSEFKTESIESLPNDESFALIDLPYIYGGVDEYMWTKASFSNLEANKTYFGLFDFGVGSGGLTVGAETLLYISGKEKSGVDLNHKEIELGLLEDTQELMFRTWTGIADETRLEELDEIQGARFDQKYHQITNLCIYQIDQRVNNLYYNLFAMLEAYKALKTTDLNSSTIIISDLSNVFLKYDEADLSTQLLYKLDSELANVIDNYPHTKLIKMIAVGQTHIDLAWLWRIKHTREKAARSFATMLNLMDNNPEYTFFQSQPQLFEFLKEDYPQIYARIKEYVCQGRIEIDGAMWLEADCNIPSGESLTRQILYGKQFIKSEFGTESKIMWMPDVFGYSWAMPQILRKSGVETFCTTKMQWNQQNRMPFNTFKWKGIDGSEITTHLIEDFDFFTINAKSMISGSTQYKDKDLSREILYQYGFGDGGGGPRQEDIELVKRFNKIPGLPAIEYGSASTYFNDLNSKVSSTNSYVHTWDGELYLELHRGTFTSQAAIKKYNRKLELKLRELEMMITKGYLDGYDVSHLQIKIKEAWRMLLLNQFHDIIPGSSIHDVNVDAIELYEQMLILLMEVEETLIDLYPQSSNSFVVLNTFNLPITTEVCFKSNKNLTFYIDDQKLQHCYQNGVYKIIVSELKPLAYTTIRYEVVNDKVIPSKLVKEEITQIEDRMFSTTDYDVKFNNKGQITYLFDREINKNIVSENKVLNKVVSYEDKPLMWDAWDIDIFYKNRTRELEAAEQIKIVHENKIETVLEFRFSHLKSTIVQTITLSNITKRIDIKHQVDWNNSHRLLRVLCETGIRATNASFDIQYGNVQRPTHSNTSWDMQKFEVLGHKWGDISNNSYGISLLNDCKYGYNCEGDVLGLSLIKAAKFPDKTQDIGCHEYTYSIYVHKNDVLSSNVETEAFKLNNQMRPLSIKADNSAIFDLQDANVNIDAIKISEAYDGIIVRLHEQKNTSSDLKVNVDFIETDLLEVEIETDEVLKPYEIKTIKLLKS